MVRSLSVLKLLKTTSKSAWLALVLLLPAVGAAEKPPEYRGPFEAGTMAEPRNQEASGLAASRRTDGLLWTHNDSGGEPVLFALSPDGTLRGKVRVAGVENTDWEDLASCELDGQPMLVIADTGDNFAVRSHPVIHFVLEPAASSLAAQQELSLRPAWSVNFNYEDGARDCEAVAVDVKERAIYLLTKRDAVPRLYRLALKPAAITQPALARFIGTVPHLPQAANWKKILQAPAYAFYGWPTAMDFSTDGSLAVVLTYGETLLFPRAPGESWASALAREPVRLAVHGLPQAEAACFSRDGSEIFVASEKTPRLLRYLRR
jgi:hypothetical protein